MKTVAVVDYGMGNLRSVSQAVLHAAAGQGVEVVVTHRPEEVRAALERDPRMAGVIPSTKGSL